MKSFWLLGAAAGLLVQGDCTTTSIEDQLATVESQPGQGSAYAQALHKDYSELARTLLAGGRRSDALYWNAKSARAAKGEELAPENPDAQGMSSTGPLADAKQAESRLNAKLATDAKVRDPSDMALAQVSFDCMMRHWGPHEYFSAPGVPENPKDIRDRCRERFEDSMATLEKVAQQRNPLAARPERDFWVYFDYNQATLTDNARKSLDELITAINAESGLPQVTIVGHTDTSGKASYNMKLSEKRAHAVLSYLLEHGVPTNFITTKAMGEKDLRVETRDNVKEAQNRNVKIVLQ